MLFPPSFLNRTSYSLMNKQACVVFTAHPALNFLLRMGQVKEKKHLTYRLCPGVELSLQWAWLSASFLLISDFRCHTLADGPLRAAWPTKQNSRCWGHCFLVLALWLVCFLMEGWNSCMHLGGKGQCSHVLRTIDLFLAWIKADLLQSSQDHYSYCNLCLNFSE